MQINNILNRFRIRKGTALFLIILLLLIVIAIIYTSLRLFKFGTTSTIDKFLSALQNADYVRINDMLDDELKNNFGEDFQTYDDTALSLLLKSMVYQIDSSSSDDSTENISIFVDYYKTKEFNTYLKDVSKNTKFFENGNFSSKIFLESIKDDLASSKEVLKTSIVIKNSLLTNESMIFADLKNIADESLKDINLNDLSLESDITTGPSSDSDTTTQSSDSSNSSEDAKNTKNTEPSTSSSLDTNASVNNDISNQNTNSNNNFANNNVQGDSAAVADNSNNVPNNNSNGVSQGASDNISYQDSNNLQDGQENQNLNQNSNAELQNNNIVIGTYYTVKNGDDLIDIARRAYAGYENPEIYVYQIIESNGLQDSNGTFYLFTGQALYIPEPIIE